MKAICAKEVILLEHVAWSL